MEEIMGIKMAPPICLKEFLANYTNLLKESKFFTENDPSAVLDIKKNMNFVADNERFAKIEEACSLDPLKLPDDVEIHKYTPGVTDGRRILKIPPESSSNLKTKKMLWQSKDKCEKNPFKRSVEIFKMVQTPADDYDINKFFHDLLITIRVYRPRRTSHIGQNLESPCFAEEFQCLGSNFLCELRDKISCICNKKRFFDISHDPDIALPDKEKDPGYFFITDTFYNDMRNPDNPDYSEIIMNWAKKARGLEHFKFKVDKLETTRFLDLDVSLGFPQLYQHHGNCEHVFIFSQIEILAPSVHSFSAENYPLLRSYNVYNNRLCVMCGTQNYSFIVEKSNRQLHDPAYLCRNCFYGFHYVDQQKIGTFKAYRVREIEMDYDDNDESSDDESEEKINEESNE